MISAWWIPLSFFIGCFVGILAIALVSANRTNDD